VIVYIPGGQRNYEWEVLRPEGPARRRVHQIETGQRRERSQGENESVDL